MEQQTVGKSSGFEAGAAATGGAGASTGAPAAGGGVHSPEQQLSQAAQRLSEAIADLDRRYGVTQKIKENPWPALAVAAGVGFALAGSELDRGAGVATTQATRGVRSSASSLLDTLGVAATATITQALHGQLDRWVAELKQAIGAPTTGRA